MGQYVQGVLLLIPMATIEPVAILGQTSEVNDAEERRVAGPIGIIGSRLAEVVETCPDELTHAIGEVFVEDEVVFGEVAPVAVLKVVPRPYPSAFSALAARSNGR